jgi:nucleotide-binding universal stress UspA family protein
VTDYAAWAANRMQAPLELLHMIDLHPETSTSEDYSGTIGFDTQEALLNQLSEADAKRNKLARETGRIFLNQLKERAVSLGAQATDVRQRHGSLVETLIEQTNQAQLYVLGRQGESADKLLGQQVNEQVSEQVSHTDLVEPNHSTAGHSSHADDSTHHSQNTLGGQFEAVVRQAKQPILTVNDPFTEPKNIMVAFDGSAMARHAVELIAGSALFKGLAIHVLMFGKESRDSSKQLDWAQKTLEAASHQTFVYFITGDAQTVVSEFVKSHDIDFLVMGAYSHSHIRNLFFGSKTTDLLHTVTLPTLLVR